MTALFGQILIIDDDFSLRRALTSTLSALGFAVIDAASGERGLQIVREERVDVVLLDMNMPGMGGMAACRELRRFAPSLQILMLTVRDTEEDVVGALDAGADDYITKPFHLREVVARLKAATRRSAPTSAKPNVITINELTLDAERRSVSKRDQVLHLTPKEFDILQQLMLHAGMPLTHAKLLRAVWGPEYGGELEYLRTFIRQLRVKIEDDPANPVYIFTDAFVGYRFRDAKATTMQDGPETSSGRF